MRQEHSPGLINGALAERALQPVAAVGQGINRDYPRRVPAFAAAARQTGLADPELISGLRALKTVSRAEAPHGQVVAADQRPNCRSFGIMRRADTAIDEPSADSAPLPGRRNAQQVELEAGAAMVVKGDEIADKADDASRSNRYKCVTVAQYAPNMRALGLYVHIKRCGRDPGDFRRVFAGGDCDTCLH